MYEYGDPQYLDALTAPPPNKQALMTALLRKQTLAQARPAPTLPTPGQIQQQRFVQPPAALSQASEDDQAAQIERQREQAQRHLEQVSGPSAAEVEHVREYGKQRSASGGRALVLALQAQEAGLHDISKHYLRQADEAKMPQEFKGVGTVTEQGLVNDVGHQQSLRVRQAEARIANLDRALAANLSAGERRRLAADRAEEARALRDSQLGLQAAIAQQASLDRRYAAELQFLSKGDKAPGKDKAGEDAATALRNGQETLRLLDEAERHLPNATASGVGTVVDKTLGYFGGSTGGSQATSALDTIAANLVALTPKMSGPQSDKDVENYKKAVGNLADSTRPYADRKAALDQIRSLNAKYAAPGSTPTTMPRQGVSWDAAPPQPQGRQPTTEELLKKY